MGYPEFLSTCAPDINSKHHFDYCSAVNSSLGCNPGGTEGVGANKEPSDADDFFSQYGTYDTGVDYTGAGGVPFAKADDFRNIVSNPCPA